MGRADMQFRLAPELREIAKQLLEQPALKWRLYHIILDRVEFLYEVTCEETDKAGECRRVNEPWHTLLAEHGDYLHWVITVYGYHAEGKSREWLQILIYHELRHIGIDGKIVEHDIESFRDILREVGIDWDEDKELPDLMKLEPKLERH